MTTLDDLKRAIEAWEVVPTSKYAARAHARVEAWRTAFEWRDQFTTVPTWDDPRIVEYTEGMRLIREKLR